MLPTKITSHNIHTTPFLPKPLSISSPSCSEGIETNGTVLRKSETKKEKKESQSISGKLMSDLRNVTNSPANGEQINLIKCHFFRRTPVFRTQTNTQSQGPLSQTPNIFIDAIDRSAINKKLQKYCATTPWCGANGGAQRWIVACFGCGVLFESDLSLRDWLSYVKADTY